MNLAEFEDRHPHLKSILQFFESGHLAPELRDIAEACENLAEGAALMINDHPQLITGMQYLLNAKDAFVRALADQTGIISGQTGAQTSASAPVIPVATPAPGQAEIVPPTALAPAAPVADPAPVPIVSTPTAPSGDPVPADTEGDEEVPDDDAPSDSSVPLDSAAPAA